MYHGVTSSKYSQSIDVMCNSVRDVTSSAVSLRSFGRPGVLRQRRVDRLEQLQPQQPAFDVADQVLARFNDPVELRRSALYGRWSSRPPATSAHSRRCMALAMSGLYDGSTAALRHAE